MFFHYYQTADGLVIEQNNDGVFEYLNMLDNDSIVLSGIKAKDIEERNTQEIKFIKELQTKPIKNNLFRKELSGKYKPIIFFPYICINEKQQP